MEHKAIRAIISGGGTGGHIFPAVSIANKLRELNPGSEILFVGAEGRMEMEKVPASGYEIKALPITGLSRGFSKANLALPFKVVRSLRMAKRIIREFRPDIAIGVGGYASAPLLYAAQRLGIPTLIQEQNGFAGLTNKILGRKAKRICVAYEGMERFFPKDRIVLTGNPVRSSIKEANAALRDEGTAFYGFNPEKKHILIIGGSLGSRTLNVSMKNWIDAGCPGGEGVEVLWQCGKYYWKEVDSFMEAAAAEGKKVVGIVHTDFIARMDLAYAMADMVISRSGASSISELCIAGKAAVFVPSPNVTEDHQTHNAMALVRRGAGMLVKDSEAPEILMKTAVELLADGKKMAEMEKNIRQMALPGAADAIAGEIYRLV
ncbi:MAG: undecaprenyldiphospho-muramoylpentapeptide beta-N-acetylglucosaminyltransferase [Bacteroidales bacterium]|nr:undecaprenyldiphospho-muramoylpentapeptide beta-N-acetylglucosaminyltransferase [Bacteroidales bacterium]